MVLLELTVPWEERMEKGQERKREKYEGLPWGIPVEGVAENL